MLENVKGGKIIRENEANPQKLTEVHVYYIEKIYTNGEHLYSAFSTKLKALDTHYYPDRPGINLKPSQLPWKYTVQLPVRRSD